jgi:hypothetical protein
VTLFKKVKQVLGDCNLQLNNIRGQMYDNAVLMKGQDKGLQALIKKHQ